MYIRLTFNYTTLLGSNTSRKRTETSQIRFNLYGPELTNCSDYDYHCISYRGEAEMILSKSTKRHFPV